MSTDYSMVKEIDCFESSSNVFLNTKGTVELTSKETALLGLQLLRVSSYVDTTAMFSELVKFDPSFVNHLNVELIRSLPMKPVVGEPHDRY